MCSRLLIICTVNIAWMNYIENNQTQTSWILPKTWDVCVVPSISGSVILLCTTAGYGRVSDVCSQCIVGMMQPFSIHIRNDAKMNAALLEILSSRTLPPVLVNNVKCSIYILVHRYLPAYLLNSQFVSFSIRCGSNLAVALISIFNSNSTAIITTSN